MTIVFPPRKSNMIKIYQDQVSRYSYCTIDIGTKNNNNEQRLKTRRVNHICLLPHWESLLLVAGLARSPRITP